MLSAPYMWGYKLNINPNMWWYMKMAKVQFKCLEMFRQVRDGLRERVFEYLEQVESEERR
jgi:hypothetical protein